MNGDAQGGRMTHNGRLCDVAEADETTGALEFSVITFILYLHFRLIL